MPVQNSELIDAFKNGGKDVGAVVEKIHAATPPGKWAPTIRGMTADVLAATKPPKDLEK
jgi:hypothetical protein